MTQTEVTRLATYNAERARGIMHTPEWGAQMAELQQRFSEELRADMAPTITVLERPCPRRQCRGRLPHSRLVHWLGWVRR